MPESVKAEILAEGAERAIHTSYRNLRNAMLAMLVALLVALGGNAVAYTWVFQSKAADCSIRKENVATTRQLWNAVFDELGDIGGDDTTLDRLQDRVATELKDPRC
jgi:enhancing lycopene biosynthesis protein 2